MKWASAGGLGNFIWETFAGWPPINFTLGDGVGADDADLGRGHGMGEKCLGGGAAIGPAGAEDLHLVAVGGPAWALVEIGGKGELHGCGPENIAVPINYAAGWAGADGDGMRWERGGALGWRLGGWPGGAGGEERASG